VSKSVSYIAVRWLHSDPRDPVELFSELDDVRNEIRKVEVFADGRAHYADSTSHIGDTMLGLVPVPPLDEIAGDLQFVPRVITAEEFAAVWVAAHDKGT
jgi:hypothetical protein